MIWKGFEDTVIVAGHRGVRFTAPENTLTAFQKALDCGVDMIETDVHMTADRELVVMHDSKVDRTTDGTGFISDMTLEHFKTLDAAYGFERYQTEAPPSLREFLDLCAPHDGLLINFELKDYPTPGNETFAYACADKTIAMIEKYQLTDRCLINSFSGALLEYVADKYGKRYQLHGFYPYQAIGKTSRNPAAFLDWLCILNLSYGADDKPQSFNFHTPPQKYFDTVRRDGIDIGVGSGVASREETEQCVQLGAKMITADYPEDTLHILRALGYHA